MRIVLAAVGSFGDLHPYLAIARELRSRGHEVTIASMEFYRPRVEALGFVFASLRPEATPHDPKLVALTMDRRHGPENILRQVVFPALRETYEDMLHAASGADAIVSHPLTYAVPLVAEKLGIPWFSSVLAPMVFLSAYDPPVIPGLEFLSWFRAFGPGVNRAIAALGRGYARRWADPIHELRRALGLPRVAEPLFLGQNRSEHGVLALFSSVLFPAQPDWPPNTEVTGFPFFDQEAEHPELPVELKRFLDAGDPPLVFTLGTAAVRTAGDFYEQSARAARLLGRRAILLIGDLPENRPSTTGGDLFVHDYAPYAKIFPRAAAVIHQCGVGTLAQSLRAGKPLLAVPFSNDQPDNAIRAVRAGFARRIPSGKYVAERAARELEALLSKPAYTRRAEELRRAIAREDGACAAAVAIEEMASKSRQIQKN